MGRGQSGTLVLQETSLLSRQSREVGDKPTMQLVYARPRITLFYVAPFTFLSYFLSNERAGAWLVDA